MDFKNIPPWKSITIPSSKLPPGIVKQRAALNELDVENSPRYKAAGGKTYCNIFVQDWLDALGVPPSHTEGGRELSANDTVDWLAGVKGAETGWIVADRKTAVDAAARGHVVLVAYRNHTGHSGHIAIVLPEGTIAQAGRSNFVGKTIREGFGDLPTQFFIHAPNGPHKGLESGK